MKNIDGNIESEDGKVLLFSIENFVSKICNEDSCFICGIERSDASFNDEHIIPRWVLKRYNLFGKTISLPNEKKYEYGKYKIPCCENCNSFLGDNIEKKVAEGFDGDFDSALKFFKNNANLVFNWICLIYIKTHLKDKSFRYDFISEKMISDVYDWKGLHHIHCMARSIYTGVDIEKAVYGSMFIYPCAEFDDCEQFDYIDLYGTGTVLIRLGGFFIICVMDDSALVRKLIKSRTDKITGKLNFLQVRELYSRVTYENLRIIDKPKYSTGVRFKDKYIKIRAKVKRKIRVAPHNEALLGRIMYKLVKNYIYNPTEPELKALMDVQIQAVKNGQWTYLFDSKGKFLNDSVVVIDDENSVLEDLKKGINIFSP